jgi:hypothetical protein
MKTQIALALMLWGTGLTTTLADATLVYELKGPDSEAVRKTLYASRFFVRAESSEDEGRFLLFQAGKFFPLYSVNQKERTYTLLTPPVKPTLGPASRAEGAGAQPAPEEGPDAQASVTAAETSPEGKQAAPDAPTTAVKAGGDAGEGAVEAGHPPQEQETAEHPAEAQSPPRLPPAPQFKPTPKTDEIAGVSCRVILELIDGEPAIEHCMANKAALGITERELRTLARLLVMARERNLDWLGAATEDEQFISVRSRDIKRGKTLSLQSVSTAALPPGHLRVPRDYTEVKADGPDQVEGDSAMGEKTESVEPVAPADPVGTEPAAAAGDAAGAAE